MCHIGSRVQTCYTYEIETEIWKRPGLECGEDRGVSIASAIELTDDQRHFHQHKVPSILCHGDGDCSRLVLAFYPTKFL